MRPARDLWAIPAILLLAALATALVAPSITTGVACPCDEIRCCRSATRAESPCCAGAASWRCPTPASSAGLAAGPFLPAVVPSPPVLLTPASTWASASGSETAPAGAVVEHPAPPPRRLAKTALA